LEGFEFDKEKIFEDVLSVAKATSENTSSMRADVLKKRVTEIDKINGAFVKLAKKHGTEAPFNELIQDLIKYKEGKY
ncbi:MAG: ketopantoate reductase C-terminal domain-containing protein, partial [Neofamilia sp.]